MPQASGSATGEVDIACTLEGADFARRVAEWRELGRSVKERTVEPGRVTAIYPRGDGLEERLARLIEAESACCPFLRFDMREEDESIRLELTFPPEAEAMIDQVIGVS